MLCQTEWSWELRTWSHKMNLLDILSTSPRYFVIKSIRATNENSNFDLMVLSVKKRGEPCKWEKNRGAWLARRVTRVAAGSPFYDGRVTLLADPTFLHTNTLARPAGSTRSRWDNQSMCEHCWLGQKGQLFFSLTHLEGDPLFRDNFSLFERGLKGWNKTTV